MVYADQATDMELKEKALPWIFDVDEDRMPLVSEAYRIHLAYLFDPYLAYIRHPSSRYRTKETAINHNYLEYYLQSFPLPTFHYHQYLYLHTLRIQPQSPHLADPL